LARVHLNKSIADLLGDREVVMKYYIGPHGFEVRHPSLGRQFIEHGILVDDSLPAFAHCVGQGPPRDAIAADQQTYNAMTASQPAWSVRYHLAAGIVPAPGTAMPKAYFEERNIDGTAVIRRPG
jgi:hypothetical protein